MWAGFLEGIEKTSVALFAKIKHLLLELFSFLDSVGTILAQGVEDRITSKELQKMLKDMNEESRIHVRAQCFT